MSLRPDSATRCSLAALVIGSLNACGPLAPPDPTYHRDVKPLLAKYCQECHQPTGVAPVPALDVYETARSYANPIRRFVEIRSMPPWGVDNSGECGTWDGARWMTDAEISTIATWQKNGAPEGDPDTVTGATPAPPTFHADATLDISGVYRPGLGAGGNRCFLADPQLDRDRLLTAIRVLSDDPRAVSQVTLFALDSASAEAEAASLDAAEPGLGYHCFGTARTDARLVASWSWPTPVLRMPNGTGVRLSGGRKMVIQIHYDVSHTSSSFQSATRVDLELDDRAAEARIVGIAAAGPLAPGLEAVSVDAERPAGQRMRVVGVASRMHIRGHRMRLESRRGTEAACLANFDHWDFYEQQLFRAASPKIVEADDSLHLSCTFNTQGRTEPVVFGDDIDDEECVAYLFITD